MLDAGALIAVDNNDRAMMARLRAQAHGLDHHTLAGREYIRYRFLLRRDWAPEEWHVIEQVGFLRVKEGRISRLDLVCPGFFPAGDAVAATA